MTIFAHQDELIGRVVDAANELGNDIDAQVIDELVENAFWASLQTNEYRPCRFILGLLTPEQAIAPVQFDSAEKLSADLIRRLSAGSGRKAILGVRRLGEGLYIWGFAHSGSTCDLRVDCTGTGQLSLSVFAQPLVIFEPKGSHYLGNSPALRSVIFSVLAEHHKDTARKTLVDVSIRRILRAMVDALHGGTLVISRKDENSLKSLFDWVSSTIMRAAHPSRIDGSHQH